MKKTVISRARHSSNAARCVTYVIRRIRAGILKPTHRLGEDSIAREMGIGRAPVRIAFERLVSNGLLERKHRSGTFVRQISLKEWCEEMDVRSMLEGLAARLACERATSDQLAQLRELAHKVDDLDEELEQKPNSDRTELAELELKVHTEIANLSGNPSLIRILSTQHVLAHCVLAGSVSQPTSFTPSQFVSSDQQVVAGNPTHREIVDAVAKRDADLAERLLREHVLCAKQGLVNNMFRAMGLKPSVNLAKARPQ